MSKKTLIPLLVLAVGTMLVVGPAEAAGVFCVKNNRVYLGQDCDTKNPARLLHVEEPGARLLVKDNSPTTAARVLFELKNNGNAQFLMENTGAAGVNKWTMEARGTQFTFNKTGTGDREVVIRSRQDAIGPTFEVDGSVKADNVTFPSSRALKNVVETTDGRDVLQRLAEIPISRWTFKEGPQHVHLGPMAEDFHSAFELGSDDKTISALDSAGVAMAAIQGLYSLVQERQQDIEQLERENAVLNQQLGRLAVQLERLEAEVAKR